MRLQEQAVLRNGVTKVFMGVRMDDPLWQKVADCFDWKDVWPVIDEDCRLTGEVVWPSDWEYLPHYPSFDAVIRRDVAVAEGWIVDLEEGHARPNGGLRA